MNSKKLAIMGIMVMVVCIIGIIFSPKIFETVEKSTYQVKQAAITGDMTAKMTPGMYGQWFGDIVVFPKGWTYFFTHDQDVTDDIDKDTSIEVRFNDGSLCNVSGTLRVLLPTTEQDAIDLVVKRGHKTYGDVEAKLIQPHVRNVLRTTANLMSARESYSTGRIEFVSWAKDQIQNGVYDTVAEIRDVEDLVTGEKIKKSFQVIRRDKETGAPVYQGNPLDGTGIIVKNFEIKSFRYEPKVQKQIATQQEAYMAVATAKANAEKAEQDKRTIVAQGKAKVATAQYEKEQEKIRAIVEAEQKKEVARLDKEAAVFTKQKEILLGEGLATRKRLVMNADGALKQKLATYETVMSLWAEAFANRKVPTVIIGGGGAGGGADADRASVDFETMISVMMLQNLGLDLTIPVGQGPRVNLTKKKGE
jgi:regulator of protease activity HflC (stomatin/prohibitin superfamily)